MAHESCPHSGKKAFFDQHAHGWDQDNYSADDLTRIQGLIQGLGLKPGWKVLDVGTGNGVLVPFLLEAVGSSGEIVGLDISPAMLAMACARGFPKNVRFVEGRAEDLPLPDKTVDAVMCFSVFPHLDDHPGAMNEVRRVLRPGGPVIILHIQGSDELNRIHQKAGGAVAHDHMPGPDKLKCLLERCGFQGISVTDRTEMYLARAVAP